MRTIKIEKECMVTVFANGVIASLIVSGARLEFDESEDVCRHAVLFASKQQSTHYVMNFANDVDGLYYSTDNHTVKSVTLDHIWNDFEIIKIKPL
jgi:hypothetical protein